MKQLGEPSNDGGRKFSPALLVGPALFGGILLVKSLTQVQPYRQINPYEVFPKTANYEENKFKRPKLKMDTSIFENDTTN